MVQLNQASLNAIEITPFAKNQGMLLEGIFIAITIISLWSISLGFLLFIDVANLNILWILAATLWQTFLFTGLFITAHDAMHGVVAPQNIKLNNLIGTVTLFLYALFPYKDLLRKHWLHHHSPATEIDPDFHDTNHKNFFSWYFNFMKSYVRWTQIIGFTLLYNLAKYGFHIPDSNLNLFWVAPAILSSLQLFYFGTFLPHREPEGGYTNPHRAQTNHLPVFWSFIACYHFGYHEEHHEYPHLPWWKLPEVYKNSARQSIV